jgi:hypothetical protein
MFCFEINLLQIQHAISIKLGANHPWVKGILNCTNKDQVLFKGEIITKM